MRIRLKRPRGGWLHHDVEPLSGKDSLGVCEPCAVQFTLPAEWHGMVADDGHPVLMKGGTLVVVEGPEGPERAAIVDGLSLSADHVTVAAGGFSTLSRDIPWEGKDRVLVAEDPVRIFRDAWAQIQDHPLAALGIRVTGDSTSGGTTGKPASDRWYAAKREVDEVTRGLKVWEGRMLTRARLLEQRETELTRAAGLKRVGTILESDNPPDDPGYKADSTVWVRESSGRAHAWRDTRWVSQSQADPHVVRWRTAKNSHEVGKRYLDEAKYRSEPAQEALDELEREAEEPFDLTLHSVHSLSATIKQLEALGPFEWIERVGWRGEDVSLALEVAAPSFSRRRDDLWFDLDHNIEEMPVVEAGEAVTEVMVFGAGQGSETPVAQRSLEAGPIVRRMRVETDSDAYTQALTNAASNKLRDKVRRESRAGFKKLVVTNTKATPLHSFGVGDVIWIRGSYGDGTPVRRWTRITKIAREWGENNVTLEVEDE